MNQDLEICIIAEEGHSEDKTCKITHTEDKIIIVLKVTIIIEMQIANIQLNVKGEILATSLERYEDVESVNL